MSATAATLFPRVVRVDVGVGGLYSFAVLFAGVTSTALKFFGVLILGIVIGAGGGILLARAQLGPSSANATDNYKACLQDAFIGTTEQKSHDWNWFNTAVTKCAKQYRVERESGR